MSARRPHAGGVRGRKISPQKMIAFTAAGMLGGVLIFHTLIMPLVVRHGNEVDVPDLRGLDPKQAAERLSRAGLRGGEERQSFDDEIAAGLVSRQDPPARFRVKKGREVHWVVSLGREAVRVPDLIGETVDHARFVLSQRGISVGDIRTVHNGAGGSQQVVASSPPSDSAIVGRRDVALLVNAGRAPDQYLMPDLRGSDAERLALDLEDAGFKVRVSYGVSRTGSTGRVIEQSPRPGHPIDEGGTIELVSAR